MSTTVDAAAAVAEAFRRDWAGVVAHVIATTRDWDLAEECAQGAFARAAERWPIDGVPSHPAAWLRTTARHQAIDRIRRDAVGRSKLEQLAADPLADQPLDRGGADVNAPANPDLADLPFGDDRLCLIFTCCHPALSTEAQVALTLRTVAGLRTDEIARAFMVPTDTMAKRLVRAKGKIRDAVIPFRVPDADDLPDRTAAVLNVVYGLFNEGYAATSGDDRVRQDLCDEAVRLARLLAELMPGSSGVHGLLALLLLHDSRRGARTDGAGDLVTLELQDRGLWDRGRIDEGLAALDRSIALGRGGTYQLHAAISACHATARTWRGTDWLQIAALYGELARRSPSPVVELNRAVAVSMADGPAVGLALTDDLVADGRLDGYHLLHATRADLLRRLGRTAEAGAAYHSALALAPTDPERRFIERRLAELGVDGP